MKRERRNAAARRSEHRVGEVAQERHRVLGLVGVEEPETLVDVGRNPPLFQFTLELTVTRSRAEQDADVSSRRATRHAGLAIAHAVLAQDSSDFVGDGARTHLGIVRGRDTEHESLAVGVVLVGMARH